MYGYARHYHHHGGRNGRGKHPDEHASSERFAADISDMYMPPARGGTTDPIAPTAVLYTYTRELLETYVRTCAYENRHGGRSDLEGYLRTYHSMAQVLLARNMLCDYDAGRYFLMGLPRWLGKRAITQFHVDLEDAATLDYATLLKFARPYVEAERTIAMLYPQDAETEQEGGVDLNQGRSSVTIIVSVMEVISIAQPDQLPPLPILTRR